VNSVIRISHSTGRLCALWWVASMQTSGRSARYVGRGCYFFFPFSNSRIRASSFSDSFL
jgi:hypothetical protein